MNIDALLSVFAPHDCLGCGAEGGLLCRTCRRAIPLPASCCYKCHIPSRGNRTCSVCRVGSSLTSVQPATDYNDVAKSLIWKLKFGRARGAASEAAELIAARLPLGSHLRAASNVVVAHAPTAHRRARQRGYDQAELLARALARSWGLHYAPLLVRRGRQKQIGAGRSQRTLQLVTAFHPIRTRHIRGAHVILIDDVITTGATLEAAAQALTSAGARRVDAVVFARA